MANRPKRGKFMPIEVHRPQDEDESDSEDGSSEEEDSEASESSEEESTPQASTSGGGVTIKKEKDEESSSPPLRPPPPRTRRSLHGQQKQVQRQTRRRAVVESDDEDVEEEEDMEENEPLNKKRKGHAPLGRGVDEDDPGRKKRKGNAPPGLDIEDDFGPPPTPRVESPPLTIRDPKDVGKIYEKLFDTCRKLEADTGYDRNFEKEMKKNIDAGKAVFDCLLKQTGNMTKIGGHGDMYIAFLHTKISSNIIRSRAERIGSGASVFSVDAFLSSLKKEFVDEDGDYSHELCAANVAKETSIGVKTLMPLVAVVGTFDRDAAIQTPPPPKFKKPKVPIRKQVPEEPQDNSADDSANDMQLVQQNASTDHLAKEINKALKNMWRQNSQPINFYELVLDPTSFSRTIENAFTVSFLIKDGHVSLTKDENSKLKDFSLILKPEKSKLHETDPQKEGDSNRNQLVRHKFILSINPRQVKTMGMASSGISIIDNCLKMANIDRNVEKDLLYPQPHNKRGLPALKYN